MANVEISSVLKFLNSLDASNIKRNPEDTEVFVEKIQARFSEILREELRQIVSSNTGESYLDDFVLSDAKIDEYGAFTFELNFSDAVYRDSIFGGKKVYMPYIINNTWHKNNQKRFWGKDRHENLIYTVLMWPYEDQKGFMSRIVKSFNDEFAGTATVTLNSKYDK